jgi:hypothetical protein
MKILVIRNAGFIGFILCWRILSPWTSILSTRITIRC